MNILMVLQALLIVAAVSADSLVSGFAYGTRKIRIPIISVVVINIICSGILAVALFLGNIIQPYLSEGITGGISFIIMFMLGMTKIFDSAVKAYIRKHNDFKRKINFSIKNIKFILNIYANPEEADIDKSKILSPYEGACLAVALSFDSIAVGIGAGMTDINNILIIGLSFVMGVLSIISGSFIGKRIAEKTSLDLTWLSGAILVFLAVMRV